MVLTQDCAVLSCSMLFYVAPPWNLPGLGMETGFSNLALLRLNLSSRRSCISVEVDLGWGQKMSMVTVPAKTQAVLGGELAGGTHPRCWSTRTQARPSLSQAQ